jgi:uncharacterized membrane protein
MKTRTKILIGIGALSAAGICLAYPHLPATIPLHWNFSGQVDGWGRKSNVLWMGILPLAMVALFRVLPRLDPRKEAYAKHEKAMAVMEAALVVFFVGISWLVVASALGMKIDVGDTVRIGMGLLFIALGNFMGQLKRNYFVGIKTPWALADDEVWRRTHRRGAWVFVIDGILFVLSAAIPDGPVLAVLMVAFLLSVAYLFLYSYLAWRDVRRGADQRP